MSIIFKRLHDFPEHFYELDLDENSYGNFEMYSENSIDEGTTNGVIIRLRKYWRSGQFSNPMGYVYVSPLLFSSEYYPVCSADQKGKVETMIQEAYDARLLKEYGDCGPVDGIIKAWQDSIEEKKEEESE